MTALAEVIRGIIASEGPMRLDRYMGLCLGHPAYGYYMGRDPLGAGGDFITAPEVSQVFGELIGIWAIAAWAAMGSPGAFRLVELGPGRGTLMADILRTAYKAAPGFATAADVQLVETSPVLRGVQRQALSGDITWQAHVADVPDGPMILVANEFFDALPIRQFERRAGCWHEREVGLEAGKLALGLLEADIGALGQEGDVIEFAPARADMARAIGERLARHPGAALIIDYGHLSSQPGDTLQAMRRHGFVSILEDPGDCDLTSHVDFEALGKALGQGGAKVHAGLSQRDFLLAMGLEQRFAKLAATADAPTRVRLDRQMTRLADPGQMGNLFKILAATSPGLATPYPFGVP